MRIINILGILVDNGVFLFGISGVNVEFDVIGFEQVVDFGVVVGEVNCVGGSREVGGVGGG